MEITLNFPHVFHPKSSRLEDAYVLKALLDALITINRRFLQHHAVPSLYKSGVVYSRTEEWDSIPALYARGYGDCKSLACARVAEIRNSGGVANVTFRWVQREDGGKDFHILVSKGGTWEDPSRILGMGKDENVRLRR
jgi:hypothetical protein